MSLDGLGLASKEHVTKQCALNAEGVPVFSRLQAAMACRRGDLEPSAASSHDTTDWPETSSRPHALLLLSYGAVNKSQPCRVGFSKQASEGSPAKPNSLEAFGQ